MFFSFGFLTVSNGNFDFIVPCMIGLVGVICFLYLIFTESVLGRKTYCIEQEKILVKRKGVIIDTIEKKDIEHIMLIYDLIHGNLDMISFYHQGKKHYIQVNSVDEDNVMSLIAGKEYKKSKNTWYYILELFLT